MGEPRINWQRTLILSFIAMGLTVLAIVEVKANLKSYRSGDSIAPSASHVQRVEAALTEKNVELADQVWREAYLAAFRSRGWEGLIEVGEASLRIGELARRPQTTHTANARMSYLNALLRARAQGSVEGALRVAEAFAALGDREVADQCARVADRLAARARNDRARDQVRAFRERLAAQTPGVENPNPVF